MGTVANAFAICCGLTLAACASSDSPPLGFADEPMVPGYRIVPLVPGTGPAEDVPAAPVIRPPAPPLPTKKSVDGARSKSQAAKLQDKQPLQKPPATEQNHPAESAALLCSQYSLALIQCSIALEPLRNDRREFELQFKKCLKSRNFSDEPKVCRRTLVSPEEAANIIMNRRDSGFPDFSQTSTEHPAVAGFRASRFAPGGPAPDKSAGPH